MSALRGFGGKKFYAVAQPLDNTGNQRVMGCIGALMKLCGAAILIILLYIGYEHYQNAPEAPQATIPPHGAITPVAPVQVKPDVPGVPVDRPGIAPCTKVSAECGSIATPVFGESAGRALAGQTPVIRHAIASDERAALAVIYPTSAPIPVEDRECFWARAYKVSCDDVKAATAQMLQWQAEEGR